MEAIRLFCPNHVIINCLDREGFAYKTNQYVTIQFPDGTVGQVKQGNPTEYYRGERKNRDSCKSSLNRISDRGKRILELLKTYHFISFLRSYPDVLEFNRRNLHVDYWMIAQHYDFSTPVLDLTDEITTAAFFATHRYDRVIRNYELEEKGEGCIRRFVGAQSFDGRLRPVGLQPLGRPNQQDGVEFWLKKDEDFAELSDKVVFKQDKEINLRLKRAMLGGTDYFPNEVASMMASQIKEGDLITSAAIDEMLNDIKEGNEYIFPAVTQSEIEHVLREYGVHIVEAEVVPSVIPPDPCLTLDRWLFTRPAWNG